MRKVNQFIIQKNGRNPYIEEEQLSFGLNDVPQVFTQIMKKCLIPIRKIW
jgi:hypothetical protein